MLAKIIIFISLVIFVNGEKECSKNEECDMKGSLCVKNSCVCPPNEIANSLHTKCLPVSDGYGTACEDNVQCSEGLKSGGFCSNGVCKCSEGYHYFLGQCWKSSGLGEACQRNENCFVDYNFEAAICSDKKVCVCSPGYYQREYSSCRRASYSPGDPCGIYLDCKFENAVCNINRTCEVASGVFNDFNGLISVEDELILVALSSKIGDSCKKNGDCPANSECNVAKKCSCKKGFYTTDNTMCHPELGAKCQNDKDCVGRYTQCRNGTVCACKEGYVTSYDGRYCDKLSRDIGWSCLRNEQCGFFGPQGVCVDKKCQCNEKSHYVKDQMFCWILKLIGDNCTQTEDCGTGDSVSCASGKCQCKENTHASSNKTECRENSNNVGEPCQENLDCTFSNSFCDIKNKKCSCLSGYLNANGSCLPGVGGKCSGNSDCKAEGSICVKNICSCEENFVSSKDFSKCLPELKYLNESCSEDSQCAKIEATCVNGYCHCMNSSHYVDGIQCFISKLVNQDCTSYGNCSWIPHAYCQNDVCTCKSGYTWNTKICTSGASHPFVHFNIMVLLTLCYSMKEIISSVGFVSLLK